MWVAVGQGTINTIAYSYDGITWTGLGKSIFTDKGFGVAGNSNVGATIVDSVITLNANNKLDIVADNYYNTGFSNFSLNINSNS
jgi:hypothetical protein